MKALKNGVTRAVGYKTNKGISTMDDIFLGLMMAIKNHFNQKKIDLSY